MKWCIQNAHRTISLKGNQNLQTACKEKLTLKISSALNIVINNVEYVGKNISTKGSVRKSTILKVTYKNLTANKSNKICVNKINNSTCILSVLLVNTSTNTTDSDSSISPLLIQKGMATTLLKSASTSKATEEHAIEQTSNAVVSAQSVELPPTDAVPFPVQRNVTSDIIDTYTPFQRFVGGNFIPTTPALEQYRLQLYNYALNIERLRCPQYSTAATMTAAAVYNSNNVNTAASTSAGVYPKAAITSYAQSGSRLALSMSLFPQRIFQPEEPKPQHSYIGLIAMAILSSAETKLVLSDIYQYILDNYSYFRTRGPGWRNSIRHNLSLNDCFIKSGRSANGKGHYWAIHPANMDDFRKGDFRRRKAQRKVRKHMGLSVEDTGTDSQSPPPSDQCVALSPGTVSTKAAFRYLQKQQQTSLHPIDAFQQHYIGQAYGLNSRTKHALGTLIPHHYETQSVPELGQGHLYTNNTIRQQQQHPPHTNIYHQFKGNSRSNNNELAIINETTTTTASVIANLYSQSRKRQFDVASLLAPDVKVDIVGDNETTMIKSCTPTGITTTQRTVITKVSVQHQQQHHDIPYHHNHQQQLVLTHQPKQHSSNLYELDEQEDIDVVASDEEGNKYDGEYNLCCDTDADADGNCDTELNSSLICTSRRSSTGALLDADVAQSTPPQTIHFDTQTVSGEREKGGKMCEDMTTAAPFEVQYNSPVSVDTPLGNLIDENGSGDSAYIALQNLPAPVSSHKLIQKGVYGESHNAQDLIQRLKQPNELGTMDPHILGHYYGTYMAAAARRISDINLKLQTSQEHESPQ